MAVPPSGLEVDGLSTSHEPLTVLIDLAYGGSGKKFLAPIFALAFGGLVWRILGLG